MLVKVKERWYKYCAVLTGVILTNSAALAADYYADVESKAKGAIKSVSTITGLVIAIGLALFSFGMPVFLSAKSAWSNYQQQEMRGGKVNWTTVALHGGLGFIGGAFVVALVLTVLDTILGGAISTAVKSFFSTFFKTT